MRPLCQQVTPCGPQTSKHSTRLLQHLYQQVPRQPLAAHLPASTPLATCGTSASKYLNSQLRFCRQVPQQPLAALPASTSASILAAHLPASTSTATCSSASKQLNLTASSYLPVTSKYLSYQQVPQLSASTSDTSKYLSYQQVPQLPASTSATSKYLVHQQVLQLKQEE